MDAFFFVPNPAFATRFFILPCVCKIFAGFRWSPSKICHAKVKISKCFPRQSGANRVIRELENLEIWSRCSASPRIEVENLRKPKLFSKKKNNKIEYFFGHEFHELSQIIAE